MSTQQVQPLLPTSTPPPATILPTPSIHSALPEKHEPIDPAILQSGSILSGLLAAVAAQLLTFFKDDSKFGKPVSDTRDSILVFTYASLVSSIFATMSSLALTVASIHGNRHRIAFSVIEKVFKFWVSSLVVVTICTVTSILPQMNQGES